MKRKIIALYLRISRKDDNLQEVESNSISNQRGILNSYIQNNKEFQKSIGNIEDYQINEYIDDGYSGTNLNRPAIKKLLEESKRGAVYCILVKDLSRFGRNYIDVGAYIESIFPYIGVRFICINDGYDSNKQKNITPGLDMAFKGILHDYYCKELSQKAKMGRKQQMEKGKCLSAKPPYGYWKSDTEKGKLVIDEETASIVEKIYKYFLDEHSIGQIVKTLNEMSIESPNKRLEKKGLIHFNEVYSSNLCWNSHAVTTILTNEVYIGNMVAHKYVRPKIAVNYCQKADKSEWIVTEDTHEAIISKEMFYQVQSIIKANKVRKDKQQVKGKSMNNPFKGLLVCEKCHHVLTRNSQSKGVSYYSCQRCRNASSTSVSTNSNILNDLVEKELKARKIDLGKLLKSTEDNKEEKVNLADQIAKLSKSISKEEKHLSILYEQYVSGRISREQCSKEKSQINDSIDKKTKQLAEMKQEEKEKGIEQEERIQLCAEYREELEPLQFTSELLMKYISTIFVNENGDIQVKMKNLSSLH